MRSRVMWAAVVASIASGAAACGGTPAAPPHTASAVHRDAIHETLRAVYPLSPGFRRLLTVADDGAAYVMDGQQGSSLSWLDFASGRTRQISKPHGGWQIEQVQVDGGRVAWVEQDRKQSNAIEPVSWRIRTFQLSSGKVATVLSSRTTTRLAPDIHLWRDTLIHTDYHGLVRGTSDFRALDLGSGTDRLLARDLGAGQMVYDGTTLVATVTEDRGSRPGESTSDLYEINHRPPRAVTSTDHGADPQLEDDRLLWQDCHQTDCTVMLQRWPDGKAHALFSGQDLLPSLGKGFVAFVERSGDFYGPDVASLDFPRRSLRLRGPSGEEMLGAPEAHGDEVAWFTASGRQASCPSRARSCRALVAGRLRALAGKVHRVLGRRSLCERTSRT